MLNAEQLVEALPSRSTLATGRGCPHGLTIGQYRHPPSTIEFPGLQNALLVVHLKGPVAVEEKQGRSSWVRRWTDRQYVSLTPAGSPVARRFQGQPEVLLLQIAPSLLDEVLVEAADIDPQSASLIPRFAHPDAVIYRYCRLLAREVECSTDPGSAFAQDLLGRAIALAVLRRHSTMSGSRQDEPMRIAPARLKRVLEFMHAELSGNSSLTQIAALSGLSPTHFARAFRLTMGIPPHRYLVNLRMELARRLLEETRTPIAQVAERCGFEHASSFTTAFRKSTGVTPREWRLDRRT